MKKILIWIISLIFVFIVLGLFIPRKTINGSERVLPKDIEAVENMFFEEFDNPILRVFITKVSVDLKENELLVINLYSVWGIKIRTTEIDRNALYEKGSVIAPLE